MRQLVLSDKNTGITPKKENKIRTTDITKDKPQKTHSFTSRTKTTHPQTAKLQRTERHHIRKHCQTTPITALSILSTRNYKSTTSQHSTHLHTTAILGSERSTRREQELIQAPSQVGGGGDETMQTTPRHPKMLKGQNQWRRRGGDRDGRR